MCNKLLVGCSIIGICLTSSISYAELPANPWDPTPKTISHISTKNSSNYKSSDNYVAAKSDNTPLSVSAKSVPAASNPSVTASTSAQSATDIAPTSAAVQDINLTENDGYFGENVPYAGPDPSPQAPEYENNPITSANVLPVDPWSRARDKTDTDTWRRSGTHNSDLNYVGEATTYGTAMGQEMIAPEVNRHNMIEMTKHLRRLGYKIPESYDAKISNMPNAYKEILEGAYDRIYDPNVKDPFNSALADVMDNYEEGTGLDFENILFNTMRLLGTD